MPVRFSIVIAPATIQNIYWPQNKYDSFWVRFCIMKDGNPFPMMIPFNSYDQAVEYISTARKMQEESLESDYV